MPGNAAWNDGEIQKLIKVYAKKPHGQDLIAWARSVAHKFNRSANGIRKKVEDMAAEGIVTKAMPRVLVFDIETLPLEVYSWGAYQQFVAPENIIKDWSLTCWSAKWLTEPEVFGAVVTRQEAVDRNDERILKPLWKLVNKADILIGHNSNKFDIKRINTRFLLYGMGDTLPVTSIDTLSASRVKFSFSSFKLDYVNKYLGLNGKNETSMDDYRACARGDRKALQKMYAYNRNDVLIEEEYYMRIRSYIRHPNFAAWQSRIVELEEGEEQCPVCTRVITQFGGRWRSPAGYEYAAFRCPHCQAIGRRIERKPGQSVRVKRV